MNVGLIDVDGHNYPNIALMKISEWHKQKGDNVEWWNGLIHYDRVYKAKVFDDTYSKEPDWCINAEEIIGGGYRVRTGQQTSRLHRTHLSRLLPVRYRRYGIRISDKGMSERVSVLHRGEEGG